MIDVRAAPHATLPPDVSLDTFTTWAGKLTVRHNVTVAPPSEKRSLKPLGAIGANLRYPAGQTILREEDEADHFFKVLGGTVSISHCMADGRRQILDFLSTGDLFGLTQDDKYHYTADAVTQVIAVRYRRRDLDTRVGNNRALASHLLAAVIDELRAAQNRLLLLGCKSATEKVASFLLEMASRATQPSAINGHIDLPMSREDIADYLGLTVETVSRTFSRLRRAGIIALPNPNQVVVLCAKTLYELAEGGDPLLRTGGKPEWKHCSISPYGPPPSF
jgi:CRP/FNR family transcriptional regulator